MAAIPVMTCVLLVAASLGRSDAASITAEQFGQDLINFLNTELSKQPYYGKREETDPCDPDPCENGSTCTTSEQPLIDVGIYSYCMCKSKTDASGKRTSYGGYYCEIENPCDSCPDNTIYCVPTNVDPDGKFCYDKSYAVIGRQVVP